MQSVPFVKISSFSDLVEVLSVTENFYSVRLILKSSCKSNQMF